MGWVYLGSLTANKGLIACLNTFRARTLRSLRASQGVYSDSLAGSYFCYKNLMKGSFSASRMRINIITTIL